MKVKIIKLIIRLTLRNFRRYSSAIPWHVPRLHNALDKDICWRKLAFSGSNLWAGRVDTRNNEKNIPRSLMRRLCRLSPQQCKQWPLEISCFEIHFCPFCLTLCDWITSLVQNSNGFFTYILSFFFTEEALQNVLSRSWKFHANNLHRGWDKWMCDSSIPFQ